jgi:hypothetical protein
MEWMEVIKVLASILRLIVGAYLVLTTSKSKEPAIRMGVGLALLALVAA